VTAEPAVGTTPAAHQPVDHGAGPQVTWGIGDAVAGVLLSLTLSILVAVAAVAIIGQDGLEDLPLWGTALLQVPLWVALLGVPLAATHLKGRRSLRLDFGLAMRWSDIPVGLGLGLGLQVVLGILINELYPRVGLDVDRVGESAEALAAEATNGFGVALVMLIAVVGAPLFEELFYRGLFLRAVQRRFGDVAGVVAPALVFGLVHFQLFDLPALVLFGVAMGVVTLRVGRLGVAIWAHVAFNLTALLSLLYL
jgi:hypothetical protein